MDRTLPVDAPIADVLDAAAQLIKTNGKHLGYFWPAHRDEDGRMDVDQSYRDGQPCCTAGAIGVVLGAVDENDVDLLTGFYHEHDQHPVFAALLAAMQWQDMDGLYAWSDGESDAHVVARLREVAAELRGQAAA